MHLDEIEKLAATPTTEAEKAVLERLQAAADAKAERYQEKWPEGVTVIAWRTGDSEKPGPESVMHRPEGASYAEVYGFEVYDNASGGAVPRFFGQL